MSMPAEQNVRELVHPLEQAHVLEGLHEADEGVDRHPQLDLSKAVTQGHHLVVAVVVRMVSTLDLIRHVLREINECVVELQGHSDTDQVHNLVNIPHVIEV